MDKMALQKPAITSAEMAVSGEKAAASGKLAGPQDDPKLRKACAAFESFMLYYMLKTMRNSVPKGGLLGNMPGYDTYNMMLDQKIAEKAAERKGGGGLGIQKILYDQLSAGGQRTHGKTAGATGSTPTVVNVKN